MDLRVSEVYADGIGTTFISQLCFAKLNEGLRYNQPVPLYVPR